MRLEINYVLYFCVNSPLCEVQLLPSKLPIQHHFISFRQLYLAQSYSYRILIQIKIIVNHTESECLFLLLKQKNNHKQKNTIQMIYNIICFE